MIKVIGTTILSKTLSDSFEGVLALFISIRLPNVCCEFSLCGQLDGAVFQGGASLKNSLRVIGAV